MATGTRKRTRARGLRRFYRRYYFLIWTVAALVLLLGAILIIRPMLSSEPEPDPVEIEDLDTFVYDGWTVRVYPDIPVNTHDADNFYYAEDGMISCTANDVTAQRGIDVSEHNGDIDWEQVAELDLDFVLIRIGNRGNTEGQIYLDEQFEANYAGAIDAGLDVGVYFYSQALTAAEAREEAAFVLQTLDDRKLTCPVVFDWEDAESDIARTVDMTGDEITAVTVAFCREIERGGYDPMVYFNKEFGYRMYDLDAIDEWPFWLADYNDSPRFYYDHAYWQYSDEGILPGIPEKVDLNLRFIRKT